MIAEKNNDMFRNLPRGLIGITVCFLGIHVSGKAMTVCFVSFVCLVAAAAPHVLSCVKRSNVFGLVFSF